MSLVDCFYRRLIKSNLTLQERSVIADCLASCVREDKKELWNSIFSRSSIYSKPLAFLNDNGFLPISLKNHRELVSQINSLEPPRNYKDHNHKSVDETDYLDGVSDLPAVKSIINDTQLHDLVSLYLNAPANLYNVLAWWQYPMGESHVASNAQRWHRDRDDFSFLKLFTYCTDVELDSGPHAYLPKTHRCNQMRELFDSVPSDSELLTGIPHNFYTDAELDSFGFTGQRKIWLGASGTSFLEDTRGLHRAYLPTHKPRLIFSLVWTTGPGYSSGLS